MKLFEPQRGVDILQHMNTWASLSETRFHIISLIADVIVFAFPVFLIVVYCLGILKKNVSLKKYALSVFFSACTAAIINIIIQMFFDKARPETVLQGTERLLLKHLPTMSFPSDHAAVSMAFAWAVYYFAHYITQKEHIRTYKNIWVALFIWSLAMSIARVAVWIHWPTDILAGWGIWLLAVWIVRFFPKKIYSVLILIEHKIVSFLGIVK